MKSPMNGGRRDNEKYDYEDTNAGASAHTEDAPRKTVDLDAQYDFDPSLDKRVTRKFDLHILPWLFGIWLLAFIDRSNIGNAKIDGIVDDLNLTGDKFNVALVVFYILYILIDIPSNLVVKRIGAGKYLPFLLVSWGLVSTFTGFVKSYGGLVAARLFLGLCEGGLLPGFIAYLAFWYQRHDMVFRIGLFYCAAPLSGAFGGVLASGLSQIKSGGYNRWPWIFFVEGAITVVFGALAFMFLPDTPGDAKFLSEDERRHALRRMRVDAHGATDQDDVKNEKFDWHWVKMGLLSFNTVMTSFAWFFLLVPLYSFSLFLPTIIKDLGYTSTRAQLFSAPPNCAAFCTVLVVAYLADRVNVRGPFMIAGCLLAIAGYIMLLAAKSASVRYGGTFLVACGVYPGSVNVMAWLSGNSAPHYQRAVASGFQVAFANCAAFIATFTYLKQDAPDYVLGHSINIGALCLCIVTVTIGIIYNRRENQKRDQGLRDNRLAEGSEHLLGHRHPRFRYTI